jgi:hypothetical protein
MEDSVEQTLRLDRKSVNTEDDNAFDSPGNRGVGSDRGPGTGGRDFDSLGKSDATWSGMLGAGGRSHDSPSKGRRDLGTGR